MGSSTSCHKSVSVSIDLTSCLYSLSCEESCLKYEKSSFGNTENVKEIFLDDLDSSANEEEEDEDFNDSIIKELGISLCETLQIHDPSEPLCVTNPTLNQEYICNQLEVKPLYFDTDALEGLNKCATILCSEQVQSYLVNSDAGDKLSCKTVHNENFSEAENLAFVQPLPTGTKLIPALKGSRAQHGIHLNTKLSVKWAPEVYDPPVTSSSHTVKGHHRRNHHYRSKAKKDYQSHKYNKGKSSRSSVIERTHTHRRSSASSLPDPRILRLQEPGGNRPQTLLNICGQSKIDPLDLAVGSHEAIKYGSNCYVESLAPVQLPLAKAS